MKTLRFSDTAVLNSVTNSQSTTLDDITAPYTLLEWLDRTSNTGSADVRVQQYNDYLKEWRSVSNQTTQKNNLSIKQVYIRFLKELSLNYTTAEERRFLSNVNLENDLEIDAALSFYALRIREIIENVYQNRHQVTFQKERHSWKGTPHGIERAVYDDLVRYAVYIKSPALNTTINKTKILIKELYDLNQSYHDTSYKYTPGGEFLTQSGIIYTGYYHKHYHEDGRVLYMEGKTHTDELHNTLVQLATSVNTTSTAIAVNPVATTTNSTSY